MPSLKTVIWPMLGMLALFALQFALVYRVPYWGLRSPFPFAILRSVEMPIVLGLGCALAAVSTKSAAERKFLYSVIEGSLAEIVTIKAMVLFSQPLLLLVVFFLNAFMTVQLLRYGISLYELNGTESD
jgi:hypothetical protein